MSKVRPFRGVRPKQELVDELMSQPFDQVLLNNCREFSKDEIQIRTNSIGVENHSDKLDYFVQVGLAYKELIKKEVLLRDEKPAYYLVGINWEGHWLYGIVGAVDYQDYWDGKVKKHEYTMETNQAELVNITQAIDFNFSPIMIAYPDHDEMDLIVESIAMTPTDYQYVNSDQIAHKFWVVNDDEQIAQIQKVFTEIPCTYIADGHHRTESGSIAAKQRNEREKHLATAPHNYFLGIHYPASQLRLYEFNHLIRDLGDLSKGDFFSALEKKFEINKLDSVYVPKKKYHFGLYIDNKWYELKYLDTTNIGNEPVDALDVSVLRKEVETGVLGITNFKSLDQVAFLEGIKGIDELIEKVDSGAYKLAFTLIPVEVEEIFSVADQTRAMPSKATCVEPKLKSGMISRLLS